MEFYKFFSHLTAFIIGLKFCILLSPAATSFTLRPPEETEQPGVLRCHLMDIKCQTAIRRDIMKEYILSRLGMKTPPQINRNATRPPQRIFESYKTYKYLASK